ncbi:hypothetical protein DBR45_59250 [Pseudomonas sp. HMWF031]|nr:hypothetical protein DBR45_59250 [Pseudomonas sp. HMWF031]
MDFELINSVRRGSDMAAGTCFPSTMVSSAYQDQNAAGEPYVMRCASGANKIVIFLHTWSADLNQVKDIE